MNKPRVLGLVGPTASGKTALSIMAAQALGGEIVCMDSTQVYRGLDIGTAKPTPAEQALVPHHLIDIIQADAPYSVAEYHQDAQAAIHDILGRGRLPILCGGTGLYLRALSREPGFGGAPADPAIRARWQAVADTQGNLAVHQALQERDPITAANLHPNNLRRVIRALEVWELTGQPFSAQRMPTDADGPFDLRLYALSWPRKTLYQRIDQRVDLLLAQGLLDEVRELLDGGLSPEAQSMQSLGYKELVPVLMGETTLEEAKGTLARRTRNYAKRQLTWFMADPRITWLNGQQSPEQLLRTIQQEMEQQ